ncbi:uncharacterized protein DUF397 [Actinomadura pelletieri DSM 43383]|uniref:Uncharacterized protein DUF397 n=1 Tax=Actinomadura pelletieri DSM 43383 TaxID=1120940 RepID=A0A495QH03_9ACTN|nr:DUF397 domain-containing protein [Actinomadura pelletieri]RKS71180.1 uncharacterized protein DUF397 [Actinomadura pelletieri DSM 43383]
MKWCKATRSSSNGENCVELAKLSNAIGARDSKDPDGPIHAFSAVEVAALFEDIRRGRYDVP